MQKATKSNEQIELHMVKGCDHFPCIDPAVSFIHLYQKLAKKNPCKYVTSKFCLRADKPKVLIFKHTLLEKSITHPSTMQRTLENKCGFVLDYLSQDDLPRKSQVMAYKVLAIQNLEKAVLINNWGIEENKKVAVQHYAKDVFFLCKFIYVRNLRAKMDNALLQYIGNNDLAVITEQVYRDAKECLIDFSILLGDKRFLLGTIPTSVDAYVCSYLAPILKIQFPDTRLKNIIKEFPNLVQYVEYVVDTYGFLDIKNEAAKKPAETDSASSWLIISAGFVAFATVFTYGVVQGIFKVPN